MSEHDTPQEGANKRGPGRPRKNDATDDALAQLAAEIAALAGRVTALENQQNVPDDEPKPTRAPDYCECGSRLPMHFDHCQHYQAPTRPEESRDG